MGKALSSKIEALEAHNKEKETLDEKNAEIAKKKNGGTIAKLKKDGGPDTGEWVHIHSEEGTVFAKAYYEPESKSWDITSNDWWQDVPDGLGSLHPPEKGN